ncbi:MAG: pyridine nucleotide-disulfide oxidoreductase [Legionellales bacterium]|nr:pyridine nucleotide-disulfide oxidoreductase [Legionellales bacterium]
MTKLNTLFKSGLFLSDYQQSFEVEWIEAIDTHFLEWVQGNSKECYSALISQRKTHQVMSPQEIIDLSLLLETFLLHLFGIEKAYSKLQSHYQSFKHLSLVYQWVQKKLRRQLKSIDEASIKKPSDPHLQLFLEDTPEAEIQFSEYINEHPEDEEGIMSVLIWAHHNHFAWLSLCLPQKRVEDELVPHQKNDEKQLVNKDTIGRDGFSHTLSIITDRQVFHETDYCIYCHKSNTDFCRKGFPVKKGEPAIRLDAHDVYLTGCPLDEKISEMNWLQHLGHPLAAFSVIMCDNPMVPATGHRICNECMKACIYQKQTPVDVPKIETHVLNQVLSLPWGVEIYDFLARWNPLRLNQRIIKKRRSESVLVMGLGPAGFSLAHHLSMEGVQVVGMDGMCIKPLPKEWVNQPIKDYSMIYEDGEDRPFRGFGGVSEYGITARWDKNYLKLIQLLLMRRHIPMYGGARFGGNVDFDQAWSWGFSHFTIAVGAGLPKAIDIPQSMSPGMRQANDFLMTLHQGALSRMSELEVRMPIFVIGSGLTAIDTATESQAYYVRQVSRCLKIYELLEKNGGLDELKSLLSHRQWAVLLTFLEHGRMIAKYRSIANKKGVESDFTELFHQWGGVNVLYRRRLQDSPAYRLNSEEIDQALKQGIIYHEHATPAEVLLDEDGHVAKLKVINQFDEQTLLSAGSILVATGAHPNIAFGFEHRGVLEKEGRYYKGYRWENGSLNPSNPGVHCKDQPMAPITNYEHQQHRVSFIGDGQPAYHGSVVRAIASAAHAYPQIMSVVNDKKFKHSVQLDNLKHDFDNRVIESTKIASWNHVVIHAPLIATKWMPGNFIRVELNEKEPFVLFPYTSDDKHLYFYTKESIPLGSVQLMGPSGVRLTQPKETGTILMNVDQEGLNAALGFAMHLESTHKLYIHTDTECVPILKRHLKNTSVNVDSTIIPKWSYTHVWVLAKPEETKFIQSMRSEGYFTEKTQFVAATYGPMQCMLKGVCAQCLQWQVDPLTKMRTKAVYACSWQHQPMDLVAWDHAQLRRKANPVMKNLVKLWHKHQKVSC